MFIKWLKKQIVYAIIGFGAIYVLEYTGNKTGGVVGGPGHYQDAWLFVAALGVGLAVTVFGSFTKRKDGATIAALGLVLLVGAMWFVWG
jgi:hypothetical protein